MNIESSDIGSQMLFAGIRFLLAGLMVLLLGSIVNKRVLLPGKDARMASWRSLCILALTQTFFQYFFYYIGLAHVSGTKGAIMNALGTLLTVLFGMIYYRNKPGIGKVIGVCIGMSGVLLACFASIGIGVSWLGEGALLVSAIFVAVGNILNKKASICMHPMMVTGWHLFLGGGLLLVSGICMGGFLTMTDIYSGMLMAYLVFVSAAGFGMWSYLLRFNKVENVAIFMFLTPIFGTLLSHVVLEEQMSGGVWIALLLVCMGIVLVQQEYPKENK